MCQNSASKQEATTQHQVLPVGFEVRNKDAISDCCLCQICMLLLRDPVQLLCGHRYCRLCLHIPEHAILTCVTCSSQTPRDKTIRDRGCYNDMGRLSILCSFCEWSGTFNDYSDHLNAHHGNHVCQHCSRKFTDEHFCQEHQSNCQNEPISCQLKQNGCTEQYLRRDTRNHLMSEKHQSIMSSLLSPAASHPHQPPTTTSTVPNDRLHETVDTLIGSVQVLADDMQQHHSKAVQAQCAVQSLAANVSQLKVAVEELDVGAKGLTPNQYMLRQELDSLTGEVDDQRVASYDGTFLWRIANVQQKMADSESDRQTSIYSPPFYSSTTGYKMRARLYLCGDGNARRTHLSVFFVLMRGDYDAILEFPFTYKVTFALYDQSGAQRHIIDSFRPDLKSTSFQRPRTLMNIASGIPKFFPLALLKQASSPYLLNDTMFIRIIVHFNETPKTLLPFMLNINPGLPDLLHETMVKEEIKKRAQPSPVVVTSMETSANAADTK